jgi:hypothetical protein
MSSQSLRVCALVALCIAWARVASAFSHGALTYCEVDDTNIGMGTSVMNWVEKPVASEHYTFTADDGVTDYVPGELTTLHLNVLHLDYKYIGLVLYAVDATGAQVGKWDVPTGVKYWTPPSCKFKAVVHSDAAIKPLYSRFYFRAPPAGAGTLTFKVLIKHGEQATGHFYWPGTKGADDIVTKTELTLNEGGTAAAPPATRLYRGEGGNSCNNVCADQVRHLLFFHLFCIVFFALAHLHSLLLSFFFLPLTTQGLACDAVGLKAVNSVAKFDEGTAGHVACRSPILKGCAPESPSTGSEGWCWYRADAGCAAAPPEPKCDTMTTDRNRNRRFCACKDGDTVRDERLSTGGEPLRAYLPAPYALDDELSVEEFVIDAATDTVTVALRGPADRWFAVAWDAQYMGGAYATVFAQRPPRDAAVVVESILDYEGGSSQWPLKMHGWFDARCTGVVADWCRYYGSTDANNFFTCTLAGTGPQTRTLKGRFEEADVSAVPCDVDGPIAQVAELHERVLGDHLPGDELVSSVSAVTKETVGAHTTVRFTRPLAANQPAKTFDPAKATINLLWAIGQQTNGDGKNLVFAKHSKRSATTQGVQTMLTLTQDVKCPDGSTLIAAGEVACPPYTPPPPTPTPKEGEDDDDEEEEEDAGSAAASLAPPSPLVFFGVAAAASSASVRGSSRTLRYLFVAVAAVFALAAAAAPAAAHNWLNVPSRAYIASVSNPCQGKIGSDPHMQVGVGQRFHLEWATGHTESGKDFTYHVTVHLDDLHKLADVSNANLEEYLSAAPATGKIDVTDGASQRRHTADFSRNSGPGGTYIYSGKTYDFPDGVYEREIPAGDALHQVRDELFIKRSNRGPSNDNDMRHWQYTKELRSKDQRAA